MKTGFIEKFSDLTELPKDLTMGLAKLTLIGNRCVQIDNYRGLIKYSQEEIRLAAKTAQISIKGSELLITRIQADTLFIEGNICGIEFIAKNKSRQKASGHASDE